MAIAADSATCPDRCDRVIVHQRDAIPEDATGRSADVQRALADGERGLGADPHEAAPFGLDPIPVGGPQLVERGPELSFPSDELPLLGADGAILGGQDTLGILRAAGSADEVRHGGSLSGVVSDSSPSRGCRRPQASCRSASARSGGSEPRSRTCDGWSAGSPRRRSRRPAPASPLEPVRASPVCSAGRKRPPC